MQWVGWRIGKEKAPSLSGNWRHTHEAGSSGMIEIEEEENLTPQGDLALQITALPRETNGFGDIYGGWLVSQMDLAGTAMASKVGTSHRRRYRMYRVKYPPGNEDGRRPRRLWNR